MKHHQRAGCHLQWAGLCTAGPGRGVQRIHTDHITLAHKALAQRAKVCAGCHPQAAVAQRGVFQCKPEAGHADGLGLKKSGVLVPAHFAADAGLFEDVHRLPQLRLCQPQPGGHRRERRAVREGVKHRVQVMQGMADLVDRQRLGPAQLAGGVKGLLFKEAAHLVARAQKIIVRCAALRLGGENAGPLARLKSLDYLLRASSEQRQLGGWLEARQHQKTVLLVADQLGRGQIAKHGFEYRQLNLLPSPAKAGAQTSQ